LAEAALQGIPEGDVALIELTPFVDRYWYYRFMAPTGEVLEEGETPFWHKSHPYVVKMYPMTNGEIHSFVGDVIDQQRYVNRMISLNDKLIRSAAKGVLLFPSSMIPDGKTHEDIARAWRDPDSVIFFDDEKNRMSGARPEQYVNKLVNIGTMEMTQMMMGMIDEVSGVNGALRGETAFAGQSATHLAQQTNNASISILDIIETYNDLILRGSEKKMLNIQQHYDEDRWVKLAGRMSVEVLNPGMASDIDLDMNLDMGVNTPTMRLLGNDFLMQLYLNGAIDVFQLLENGDFPNADKLLSSLRAAQQSAMAGDGVSPEQMREIHDANAALRAELPQGDQGAIDGARELMKYPIIDRGEEYTRARQDDFEQIKGDENGKS
jgi:hypothetical protein